MKDYKRLTKWSKDGILHVFDFRGQEIPLTEATDINIAYILASFAKLEDKIESGEIVDRNEYLDHLMTARTISELTDNEIEFFVKHNAKIRRFVDEDIIRLTTERDDYKSRAEAAELKATEWKDCAIKWQKYYKEEVPLSKMTTFDIDQNVGRLAELEDKIESGELVNRNGYIDHLMSTKSVYELTNTEIVFLVKHNASIRKYVDELIIRLNIENATLRKQIEEMRNKQ